MVTTSCPNSKRGVPISDITPPIILLKYSVHRKYRAISDDPQPRGSAALRVAKDFARDIGYAIDRLQVQLINVFGILVVAHCVVG